MAKSKHKVKHARRFLDLPGSRHSAAIAEIRRDSESDRAVAIIGAAYVDLVLFEAITRQLERPDPEIINTLFGDGAPLQAFGARIQLGYVMAIYGKGVLQDLRTVKEIRNAFAHCAESLDFGNADVARLAGGPNFPARVQFVGRPKPSTPRELYVTAVELLTDNLLEDISRRARGISGLPTLQMKGRS